MLKEIDYASLKQLLLFYQKFSFLSQTDLLKNTNHRNGETKVITFVYIFQKIFVTTMHSVVQKNQWFITQGKLKYSPWGTTHDKRHTMCHKIQQSLIYLQLDLKHLKIVELNGCQPYLRHSFPTILVDQFQQQLHVPDVQKKNTVT